MKRKKKFNPTRADIERAVADYIASGGTIEKIDEVVIGDPENYDWYNNRDSYDYHGCRRVAPEYPFWYFG